MKEKFFCVLICIILILELCGCKNETVQEITILKLASFSDSETLREQVMNFNLTHEDMKIEMEIYENNDPENVLKARSFGN